MSGEKLSLNGIHARTGQYLVSPLQVAEAASNASAADAGLTRWRARQQQQLPGLSFGLPFDVNPLNVARAGWGVVFAPNTPTAVRKALEPLIEHRKQTVEKDRFHDALEYQQGETAQQFLERHGVPLGDVQPTKLPYYLLLVGDPEDIPYEVQHSLSLSYAVGRLSFESADEYTRYAESLVDYESHGPRNHREVTYWGPRHSGDQATQLSADHLVGPLHQGQGPAEQAVASVTGFGSRCFVDNAATKDTLLEVLHGKTVRPAVLFTASHGLGLEPDDPEQRELQGALLTQDWPGFGKAAAPHSLSARDVDDAQVSGLVAFMFACFGAGTPQHEDFPFDPQRNGKQIAPSPFVAALPRRLLSHPKGGALAVVGHVERAWALSIQPVNLAPTLHPFRNTLGRLMTGEPVGHAVRDFRDRFSVASDLLLRHYDANSSSGKLAPNQLLARWVERNDARNYVVLGDPAARLDLAKLQNAP